MKKRYTKDKRNLEAAGNGGKGSDIISHSTKRVISWNGLYVINEKTEYLESIYVESLVV